MMYPYFLHTKLLGLTGLMGAGKSSVARWLEGQGFQIFDADREAHALYQKGTVLCDEIGREFGSGVLCATGVDRKALAALVFSEPSALARLEALVHPALRVEVERRIAEARDKNSRLCVDAALLVRWDSLLPLLDAIWIVETEESIRVERLVKRGHSREDVLQRVERQRDLEKSLSQCQHHRLLRICNDGANGEWLRLISSELG